MSQQEEVSKQEMISLMYEFSLQNPEYRKAVQQNPKEMLAKQMGQDLPSNLTVEAIEEKPDTFYLIVPYVPESGDELSDADLEQVAGGKGKGSGGGSRTESRNNYTCNRTQGMGTRVEVTTNVGG